MSYGTHLFGTFEKRLGVLTQFQIMNPNLREVSIEGHFFDISGNLDYCLVPDVAIAPFGLYEIDTLHLDMSTEFGSVMFVSVGKSDDEPGKPIIGLQRRLAAGADSTEPDYAAFAESNLIALPKKVGKSLYRSVGVCG